MTNFHIFFDCLYFLKKRKFLGRKVKASCIIDSVSNDSRLTNIEILKEGYGMNIAVVGSSGYIGNFILDSLVKEKNINQILRIGRGNDLDVNLNLLVPEKFNYDCLNNIDCVIYTAAISSPDKCAEEFDISWSVNVKGTIYFINEAIKRKCKVLFFSSDAVFGDIPGYIYDEKSETKAKTAYGIMKKTIEDEFIGNNYFKVIRLSYVASVRDKFIKYCLNCMETNEIAEVFHPFYRNVITISDVVSTVIWFIKHWDEYEPFVLNVAGRELVSRVRIADELNRFFNGKLRYTIIRPEDGFYQNRPMVTQMKSLYVDRYSIFDNTNFTEKIQREFINNEYRILL